MKPTSIVFLILSVLLIIVGVITCNIAQSHADDAGIQIFESERNKNGEPTAKIDLSSEKTNKISLNLGECDVKIVGGSELCEAELTNFEKYMYSISTIDSTLEIGDGFGWKSLINLSSNGISFDGMRHLFPFGGDNTKIAEGAVRTLTIRIPSEQNIRKIDITLEKGDITFFGIDSKADITATTKSGNITVTCDLETSTAYDLRSENGSIVFDHPLCMGNTQLEALVGDISIIAPFGKICEYSLDAPLGSVTYFGTSAGHSYHSGTTMTQKLTATANGGNITIEDTSADPAV